MKTYKDIPYIVYFFEEVGHYCAYVRLPDNHPFIEKLSKKRWFQLGKKVPRRYHYDYDAVDVDCHGGLTFGQWVGSDKNEYNQGFTKGWWIGWDYCHVGDKTKLISFPGDREWTEKEVEKECKQVIEQLKKLGGE